MAEAAPTMEEETVVDKPKRPFVFVRDEGERADGIIALFNRFLGRDRTVAEYRWEFYDGPPPRAHIWVIVECATDEVVGHHGIVATPLVNKGVPLVGGRTENTIIEPAVRKRIFYPGMEKKALREALGSFEILYTVHGSGAQGRIRERFGYEPVGRWLVYLPVIRAGYFKALLGRLRDRVATWAPDSLLAVVAGMIGAGMRVVDATRRRPGATTCTEVDADETFRDEYEAFWQRARGQYDVTLDRSWAFLRWRVYDNPNLECRTWAIRRDGQLVAVVIGHKHYIGDSWSVYVDDIIVGNYADADFRLTLDWIPFLDSRADAVVLMTLDADTPLYRALRKKYPLQSWLLARLAPRVFDELVVYDRDQQVKDATWYVTALFTEGLDTSRR